MAEEAVSGLAVLIILGIGFWVFFKILKYMAYLGQYRAGKALKRISKQGLKIQMTKQHTKASSYCEYCGALVDGYAFCRHCGAKLL